MSSADGENGNGTAAEDEGHVPQPCTSHRRDGVDRPAVDGEEGVAESQNGLAIDGLRREGRKEDSPPGCGIGPCTPHWMQRLHTARCLLAVLSICSFTQSFVINAIFPVDLSTLEKRFDMTSSQTGIISSWYDFAVLIAVFPVCHWGNYGHKGRWIAVGSMIMAAGSMLCALPHFITPLAAPRQHQFDAANPNSSSADYGLCIENDNRSHSADLFRHGIHPHFLLFLLGQTLHGFGATPLFSLGTSYLDENVSPKNSPIYLAINSLLTSVGPIFGLFAGGKLLNTYEDFDRVSPKSIHRNDPQWVGAWWVGFVACSIASLAISFPIMMFARELPKAKKNRAKDAAITQSTRRDDRMEDVTEDILKAKHFGILCNAVGNILSNGTFVTIIAVGVFESVTLNGFSAFMPKILEIILNTNSTMGAYLSSVIIFGAAGGVILGGILLRQMNLQVYGMLRMVLICHLAAALALITCLLVQCPVRQFVGITIGYDHQQKPPTSSPRHFLEHSCNSDCRCESDMWSPVCDPGTGITYFSACYAGCSRKVDLAVIGAIVTVWSECKCLNISSPSSPISLAPALPHLINGVCPHDCGWNLWLFLALLLLSVVATFAAGIPTQQIMLRVIPSQHRTLGIATNWTLLRLFGFIPGGVLFGFLIDTTCLKWQPSDNGSGQHCVVYDTHKLFWRIMEIAILCKLGAILATILGYMAYRPNDLDKSAGPLSVVVNDDRPSPQVSHANAPQADPLAD